MSGESYSDWGTRGKKTAEPRKGGKAKPLIAAAVVLALAATIAALAWALDGKAESGNSETPEKAKGEEAAEGVKYLPQDVTPPAATNAERTAAKPPAPQDTPKEKPRAEEKPDPVKEKIKAKIAALKARGLPKRAFKTPVEQTLAILVSTPPGVRPIPLPTKLSEKDLATLPSLLVAKNVEEEGDSERLREQKRAVDAAKKEMAQFIKNGGKPEEFLDYYYGELNRLADKRETALREAAKLKREEPEIYEEFVERTNEKLRAEGIREIPIHGKTKNKDNEGNGQ